ILRAVQVSFHGYYSMARRRRQKDIQNQPVESAPPGPASQASWRVWTVQSAAIFAIALFVRLLHFYAMRDSLLYDVLIADSWSYDAWAQRLAAGDWIGSEVFYQTPFYPYFMGLLYALFGHSIWAVRITQAVLGSLACVFLARAGENFFSQRVGWVAGLLLAVYPPAIFFDGIVQKATLDLFLMTLMLWLISLAQRNANLWLIVAVGATLGALVLNRENAAVFVPVLLAWSLCLGRQLTWRQRWWRPAA